MLIESFGQDFKWYLQWPFNIVLFLHDLVRSSALRLFSSIILMPLIVIGRRSLVVGRVVSSKRVYRCSPPLVWHRGWIPETE